MMDPALLPRLWVIILRAAFKHFGPKLEPRHHAHIQRAAAKYNDLWAYLVNPEFDLALGKRWYESMRAELIDMPGNLWLPASCWAAIECWTECAEKQGRIGYQWLQLARATEPLANSLSLAYSGVLPTKGAHKKHENLEVLRAASTLADAGTRAAMTLWYGTASPVCPGVVKGPRNRPVGPQEAASLPLDILAPVPPSSGR
jgi:hypothetical protein